MKTCYRALRSAIFLSLLSLTALHTSAQVGLTYTFTQTIETYTPISGGTMLWSGTFDDNASSAQTIPAFYFDGSLYTTMYVTTNGFLVLGTPQPSSTQYTPISATAANLSNVGVIAPFGRNLESADNAAPEVRWVASGSEIVIQWKDVHRASTTVNAEKFSFQVRLNTTDGSIRFVYQAPTGVTTSSASSPQVGLRGPSNLFPDNVNNRSVTSGNNWDISDAGANVGATCRFTSTAPATYAAEGLTYTFTTVACMPPTALAAANFTTGTADISWASSTEALSYDWEIVPYGNAQGTGVLASGNTTDIFASASGIDGQQSITVYARSQCGESTSAWASASFINCANATPLPCSTIITYSLASGNGIYNFSGTNGNNSCGFSTPGREKLFAFTAPTTGQYYIDQDASFNDIDYLFKPATGECGTTGWTCIDDLSGNSTSPAFTLNAGTTYYLIADAESTGGGTFTFQIFCPGPPSCPAVPTSPSNNADVCGTSATLSWPAVFGANVYDVYFGTDNPPATEVSANQIGTSYSASGLAVGTYYWSIITENAFGTSAVCSTWSFNIIGDPVGNLQSNPILLGNVPLTINGNNQGCFTSTYTGTAAQGSPDVFYLITTNPCTDQLTFATCTSSFDTYLHILTESGTNLSNDDDACSSPNGLGSSITLDVLPSTNYIVVVEGYFFGTGTYTLEITETTLGSPGCTDPTASNYNASAACDDGSCLYISDCPGDFDNNGLINVSDLLLFMPNFGCTVLCGYFDMNLDGSVNVADLLTFMSAMGTFCPE